MSETTTRERKKDNETTNVSSYSADASYLRSMVVPWTTISVVAIGLTALTIGMVNSSGNDEENQRRMEDWIDESSGPQGDKLLLPQFEEEHFAIEEIHKPLMPLDSTDITGFVFATLGLMVAAGGGIGGGGILVPIYILVMGFSPKHAIPLSNITVFGGALANTVLNSTKRHPLADRPLVDWDLILIMEPLTIAGALIGAFLNKLLPETFLVVMLVLLLSFTSYTTLRKALKMYAVESRALRQQTGERDDGTKESELTQVTHKDEANTSKEANVQLLEDVETQDGECPGDGTTSTGLPTGLEMPVATTPLPQTNAGLVKILQEERQASPYAIILLVVMFVVVLMINVLKGGGAFPSPLGIRCGSNAFWIANIGMLAWIVAISFMARSYLLKRYYQKQEVGYPYVDGDIRWDPRGTVLYPIICCLAGFFAGMFGVGGGIVKGPLMLAMGVHPKVSSASSACMILFTSFTATTSFWVFGLLVSDYASICIVIGFFATFVGQIGLFYLMKKYQRNSYIAFSIGAVVLLSALLMTIQSMISIAEGVKHHSGGVCGKDD